MMLLALVVCDGNKWKPKLSMLFVFNFISARNIAL